jgi:hypothetical protein
MRWEKNIKCYTADMETIRTRDVPKHLLSATQQTWKQ